MASLLGTIPLYRIDGSESRLFDHEAKVYLVVNVASKCGLTPQYRALEALYREWSAKGLVVLGFPSNDFRDQEPGSNEGIAKFCSTQYDVTFPLFSKINVSGALKHPLYSALVEAAPEVIGDGPFREKLRSFGVVPNSPPEVQWNFEKFLVSGQGEVVARFAPDVEVDDERFLSALRTCLL